MDYPSLMLKRVLMGHSGRPKKKNKSEKTIIHSLDNSRIMKIDKNDLNPTCCKGSVIGQINKAHKGPSCSIFIKRKYLG